jgi:drug/metabolite transporter (DMT)-like permease
VDSGLLLAILSALVFGGYLYVVKRFFVDYPAPVYVLLVDGAAFCWYLPIALFTTDTWFLTGLDGQSALLVFGVAVFTGIALLAFFRALVLGAVSYVAPISKIVPVFVLPLEVVLLDQHLSPLQIGGVLVATVAIYVANYQPGDLLEPFRRAATTRAAQLALLSAAAFGVVDVGKRVMMQELGIRPQTYLPIMFAVVSLMMVPIAFRRPWPDTVRRDVPKFAGAGLLVAGGNHVVLLAFQQLPASIASPIINSQAVVAVVLGGLLLDESEFGVRLLAAGLAVAGITLITLG